MKRPRRSRSLIFMFFVGVIIAITFMTAQRARGAEIPGVIPLPVYIAKGEGVFLFGPSTALLFDDMEMRELADYLYETTGRRTAKPGWAAAHASLNYIKLRIDDNPELPAEGYRIDVFPNSMFITGSDRAGVLYGIQTLRQLIDPCNDTGDGNTEISCLTIEDFPRFGYRGFMLDEARTFSGYDVVIKLLDQMAFHKFNRFHWHLTDDEGWRLPLESYPRLAEEGGYRGGGAAVHNIYGAWGRRYGGHYDKEQIKAVVDHARFLNIEIVPEFDIPGHSRAIARLYPDILCRGPVDLDVSAGYDLRKVWCAGREENFVMIQEILDEICDIFPGALIHTGGDEVPPEQWEACPDCQALMKREGMKDTKELNTWFQNRVGKMVAARGRGQAVWNEAMDGGQVEGAPVIWAWENEQSAGKAIKSGYRTLNMTSQFYYFDMKQSQSEVGLAWAGIVDLPKTYNYNPVPDVRGSGEIIGVEGGFWTETFLWNGKWWLEYQLYPRICALAETAWSPQERRNFADFESRLERWHLARLEAADIGYRGRDGIRRAPVVPDNRMKVAYEVVGNVPCTSRNPYSHAADNDTRTFARTVRTLGDGDWVEFRFRTPVECSSVWIRSGYSALPRFVIGPAVLEVSYDGTTYEVVDTEFGYTGTFEPRSAVHKIRLTVKGEGNGEDAVIIQDLVLMR